MKIYKKKLNPVLSRRISLFSAVVMVLSAAVVFQSVTAGVFAAKLASSDAINWGVYYPSENSLPIGNAPNETLKEHSACFYDDSGEKCVYLTFDAGYENGYTQAILDALSEKGVKAAFFLTGNYFKDASDMVVKMKEGGHLVCNHTMTHPDATKLTQSQFDSQLKETKAACSEKCGVVMDDYFRPPSGIFNYKTLDMAAQLGYKSILWSVAYMDYDNANQPSHASALSTLKARTHPGAIVLLHSTGKTNSEILGEYIDYLKGEGYVFKTLEEYPW